MRRPGVDPFWWRVKHEKLSYCSPSTKSGQSHIARLGSLAPQLEVEIVPGAGHAILNVAPRIIQFLTQARDPALA